jgi:hypothetical protein
VRQLLWNLLDFEAGRRTIVVITSDPIQGRMGLWSRKRHRFLIVGPFCFVPLSAWYRVVMLSVRVALRGGERESKHPYTIVNV